MVSWSLPHKGTKVEEPTHRSEDTWQRGSPPYNETKNDEMAHRSGDTW
jgi:hypothetical protein